MQIRKTTAGHYHEYRIYLTKEEVVLVGQPYEHGNTGWDAFDSLNSMLEKEAEKIGNASRESGEEESADRG